MFENSAPIDEAAAALKVSGVKIAPTGEEPKHRRIGDFIRSDADVWRLAAKRGLVEADPR
jgi:hypothetical protein